MKFKSLAMQIWITFTSIILVVILLITMINFFFFRVINNNAKMKDLLFVHNYVLSENLNQPISFDTMQNLKGSSHFVCIDGKPEPLTPFNPTFPKQNSQNIHSEDLTHDNDNRSFTKPNEVQKDDRKFDKVKTEQTLCSFADGEMNAKEFREKIDGKNYLFIISKIDKGYLVSYMPNNYDDSLAYKMLLICFGFILLSFFVSIYIAKKIAKPLLELENFANRVARKDFSTTINIKNQDEIGRLAESMYHMQEDLKRADDEERMFLQSISHDLKTPVMVIMSHADAIIDGIFVESLENTATIIKTEAITLNKKIKELLYFNTLDYMLKEKSEIISIDLKKLIENITLRLRLINPNISWSLLLENCSLNTNPDKMTVAIENVLENALRYANNNISIKLIKNINTIEVEIFNDGKPLPNDATEKIFNHMYKDKSGNFGLGLAITKKIVEYYHGCVSAQNVNGGVLFKFTFYI